MLLTPSSLISFIASKTDAEEAAEITVAFRFKEGKDSDRMGLDRYLLNDGVARAYDLNQARRLRSETVPMNSSGLSGDRIKAVQCQSIIQEGGGLYELL